LAGQEGVFEPGTVFENKAGGFQLTVTATSVAEIQGRYTSSRYGVIDSGKFTLTLDGGGKEEEEKASVKVPSAFFYGTYHGHEVEYLNRVLSALKVYGKKKRFVYLAGDSSLDPKYWLLPEARVGAVNGYETVLDPPECVPDVCYWLNLQLSQKNKGCAQEDMAAIMTAVEATTLVERIDSGLFWHKMYSSATTSSRTMRSWSPSGATILRSRRLPPDDLPPRISAPPPRLVPPVQPEFQILCWPVSNQGARVHQPTHRQTSPAYDLGVNDLLPMRCRRREMLVQSSTPLHWLRQKPAAPANNHPSHIRRRDNLDPYRGLASDTHTTIRRARLEQPSALRSTSGAKLTRKPAHGERVYETLGLINEKNIQKNEPKFYFLCFNCSAETGMDDQDEQAWGWNKH